MYISKVSLVNYRNFLNSKFIFGKGVNTIIGENGSGKTNLFRAMRLLLDDSLLRFSYKLDEGDFCRKLDDWRGHWIIISIEFNEIAKDEALQSLFIHGVGNIEGNNVSKATYNLIFRPKSEIRLKLSKLSLGDTASLVELKKSIVITDYEVIFTGKSECDFNEISIYKELVGDFDKVVFPSDLDTLKIGTKIPHQLSIKSEISFTFVKALRDVVSEFQSNRTNPLFSLLKFKSEEIKSENFSVITNQIDQLNKSIEDLKDVTSLRSDVLSTVKEAVGETYSPSSLSIKSDLPSDAEKLFQSLKLYIGENGEDYEGSLQELSLGGANLIYLTLKLLEFKYRIKKDSFANFLLIEEPEAHIHTHIQKTLFGKIDSTSTQVIYSTHSTHISEVSNIKMINILAKNGITCEVFQPANFLEPEQVAGVQRFLDAVRCNLLFAKSVILVEGDAEEFLIPVLIKKVVGVTLDELGISLINIRSTGFKNIACLFEKTRIKKRCSIITDLDASIMNNRVADKDDGLQEYADKCKRSEKAGNERKAILDEFTKDNEFTKVFFANYTFEVDFLIAGNFNELNLVGEQIYSQKAKIEEAKTDILSKEIHVCGKKVLDMANKEGKGWFSILLAEKVTPETKISSYVLEAVLFACGTLCKEVVLDIVRYAVKNNSSIINGVNSNKVQDVLNDYSQRKVSINQVLTTARKEYKETLCGKILEKCIL